MSLHDYASPRGAIRLVAASLFALSIGGWVPEAHAQSAQFDHDLTSFPLSGAHRSVECERCHAGRRFAGTPRLCDACHDGSGKIAITALPGDHIPVAGDCGDCHSTYRWVTARMDHTVVTSQCDACHYGGMAEGKTSTHVQTTAQCDTCHRTATWRVTRLDHSGFTDPCSVCHDGVQATGKDTAHISTTEECDLCHATTHWIPATFDHSMVTANCSSCHDGVEATGKDVDHLVTTAECDLCHATTHWIPATFDHSTVMGSCSSCHDGVQATGTPTPHFDSTLECDACHSTTAWLPARYSHVGAYPGDHRRALTCIECHAANSQLVVWADPSLQPDCAGCHAPDFKPDSHKKVDSPEIDYTASELRDCSGSCHTFRDTSLTSIQERRDGEHRVGDSEF